MKPQPSSMSRCLRTVLSGGRRGRSYTAGAPRPDEEGTQVTASGTRTVGSLALCILMGAPVRTQLQGKEVEVGLEKSDRSHGLGKTNDLGKAEEEEHVEDGGRKGSEKEGEPATRAIWEERVANRSLFEVECYETDS